MHQIKLFFPFSIDFLEMFSNILMESGRDGVTLDIAYTHTGAPAAATTPGRRLGNYSKLFSFKGSASVRVPRVSGYPLKFDNGCQVSVMRDTLGAKAQILGLIFNILMLSAP